MWLNQFPFKTIYLEQRPHTTCNVKKKKHQKLKKKNQRTHHQITVQQYIASIDITLVSMCKKTL